MLKGNITRWGTVDFFNLELVIIILAFLVTYCSRHGAGVFALSLGLLIDIFSTGPLGFLTFLYLFSFLLIVLCSNLFNCRAQVGLSLLVFLVVLLKEIALVLFLFSFSMSHSVTIRYFLAMISSAVFSGLCAPVIFAVLKSGLRFLFKDMPWYISD